MYAWRRISSPSADRSRSAKKKWRRHCFAPAFVATLSAVVAQAIGIRLCSLDGTQDRSNNRMEVIVVEHRLRDLLVQRRRSCVEHACVELRQALL